MATDITFKIVKIVGERNARSWKCIPRTRTAGELTFNLELAVKNGNFNSVIMRTAIIVLR